MECPNCKTKESYQFAACYYKRDGCAIKEKHAHLFCWICKWAWIHYGVIS